MLTELLPPLVDDSNNCCGEKTATNAKVLTPGSLASVAVRPLCVPLSLASNCRSNSSSLEVGEGDL